jgi:hypothetical protein
VKKLFRRRCWRFSNMRTLELKSLAAAKRPVGKGGDDKCLLRSRSGVTGVALDGINCATSSWKRDARCARARPQNSMRLVALYRWISSRIGPAIGSKKQGSKCCFKRQFNPIVCREHREGFQFETEAGVRRRFALGSDTEGHQRA